MQIIKTVAFFTLTLFLCQHLLAQKRVWRVGIQAGSGHNQLYNSNDWNADPILIYPVESEPTDWTVGAITTCHWGKHWGLGAGLLISKNVQAFGAKSNPNNLVPDPNEFYRITNEFNYLKLPITLQFSTNNNANHQFRASLGLQTSFLMSYKEHFLQTSTGFRGEGEIRNKVSTALTTPIGDRKVIYDRFLYNRFLIGSVAELGYSYKTSDEWLFTLGVRLEYDFTNAENHQAKVAENGKLIWVSSLKRAVDNNIDSRPKTHNRAVGLFLSVNIPVNIR